MSPVLMLATENAELRAALAEAQALPIETAVDGGEMHARIQKAQSELAYGRAEQDASRRMRNDEGSPGRLSRGSGQRL